MKDQRELKNAQRKNDEQRDLLVDQKLEQTEATKSWLQALPDEEPSMEWQSQLNAKLAALQPAQKKSFAVRWKLFGSLGAATACLAIAAVFMKTTPSPVAPTSAPTFEEQLLAAHSGLEFARSTQAAMGDQPVNSKTQETFLWTEEDLNSL